VSNLLGSSGPQLGPSASIIFVGAVFVLTGVALRHRSRERDLITLP
jgi:hypothetical protein